MSQEETCKSLINALGGGLVMFGFIASELLPFIKKTKSNGFLHFIALTVLKYYEKKESGEQEELLEEPRLNQEIDF
jgi:hypothetical protein